MCDRRAADREPPGTLTVGLVDGLYVIHQNGKPISAPFLDRGKAAAMAEMLQAKFNPSDAG